MAPLPKRKHSTQRKKKRMSTRRIDLPHLVKCQSCGQLKRPHYQCLNCGN